QECIRRIQSGRAETIGVAMAKDVVPGLTDHMVLHAGPPVTWETMCGTMRGAVIGASIFEGWAKNEKEAVAMASSGGITFSPNHHQAVGPMAGMITRSMAVYVTRNETFGNETYTTLNMGLGKVLRFGAFDDGVIEKLRWMNSTAADVIDAAIRHAGGIDTKYLMVQALQMGDELHNRNKAATSLQLRTIAPHVAAVGGGHAEPVLAYLGSSDAFFLNNAMAAAKAMLDPAHGIEDCTIVTVMARNGTEFGIRVSGLGDQWFTAPSPIVDGLYFPGYSEQDANPDIGDSSIMETYGAGAFAMVAAPAIVQLVGGTPQLAREITLKMYEITAAEHGDLAIPALNFRGSPLGIDIRSVVETTLEPIIDTGIAHREPGIGQIGAGLTVAPMACFVKAIDAFATSKPA
ncbi:MAG: DUF1116 domain-containing protein, partial [Alphaproteobacteria bacterium]|nr:DUF1116 domain-containing protein [Alphaproteobacteria bacterium]